MEEGGIKLKKVSICLIILLLFVSGCSAPQQEYPELILRYADNQPKDYPTTRAAEYFAELVEERTNGKIVIRVYCNGELGDENSVMEQVQFGGIDFTRVSLGTLSEIMPNFEVLQLPYLYDGAEHMWRVLDGGIGEDFLQSPQEVGIVGLSWFDAGARSFYTSMPVLSLQDLQGLTIRVQESGFMSRVVELLGATPVQIAYGDVYSALQTAKIDGAENNFPSYAATGHYEAAPYLVLDEHSRLPEMQIMSMITMERIAEIEEDYIRIIKECAKESAEYERLLWLETEQQAQEQVKGLGCVITELTKEQLEEFRMAVQPLYESYSEEEKKIIIQIQGE